MSAYAKGDPADLAQVLEEAERAAAIARALAPLAASGRADCLDCGQPLSAPRRAAMPSAMRCTPCQSALEQRR
jgi:phage/conjugal plasmid C-4 type zinc finger TraR family protein